MNRLANTTGSGRSFDHQTALSVWNRAQAVSGANANEYRKDACGAWIRWADYGTTNQYGWEIDHVKPVAKGGTDALANLQALHWRNNRQKGDNYPNWSCAVTST